MMMNQVMEYGLKGVSFLTKGLQTFNGRMTQRLVDADEILVRSPSPPLIIGTVFALTIGEMISPKRGQLVPAKRDNGMIAKMDR